MSGGLMRSACPVVLLWAGTLAPPSVPVETHPPGEEPSSTVRLSLPGRDWSVVAAPSEFRFGSPRFDREKRWLRVEGVDLASGLAMTVELRPAAEPGDARVCRRARWRQWRRNAPSPPRRVSFSELDPWAIVEYRIPMRMGVPVDQKHLHACRVHDDVWILLHLSRPNHEPDDDALFDRALSAIRVTER